MPVANSTMCDAPVNEKIRSALLIPFVNLLRSCEVNETEITRIFTHPNAHVDSQSFTRFYSLVKKVENFNPVLQTEGRLGTHITESVQYGVQSHSDAEFQTDNRLTKSINLPTTEKILESSEKQRKILEIEREEFFGVSDLSDSETEFAPTPHSFKEVKIRSDYVRDQFLKNMEKVKGV